MTDYGEINMAANLTTYKSSHIWSFPDFTSVKKDEITENHIEYHNDLRTGIGHELLLKDVYIRYGKFQAHSKKQLLVLSSDSHVQMNFNLQSTTTYFTEIPQASFVRFKPYEHNLLLVPQRNMLVQWLPNEETEAFSINITTDFFFRNLPESHPLHGDFQNGIEAVIPAFMSKQNLPVTSKMISILFDILHCQYRGYYKSLFVKAKVIELLALQFDQYEQLPIPESTSVLKVKDLQKMHLVRNLLIENLEQPLSLKDLAHQVGTNEFNLKKYFKAVFGTTVFGYLHDFRMAKSKEQLCMEGSKIAEVAQRMGYKHATHFTAAFKKYYGYVPNKIRIVLLHLIQTGEYLMEMVESGGFTEFV